MQKMMHLIIDKIVKGKSFSDDDEQYLYLIIIGAMVFALLMHIVLFFIMLAAGISLLAIFNFGSIIVYCSIIFMVIRHHAYQAAGLICAAEIIICSLLTSFCLGLQSQVILYYFLLLLIQLIMPYARARIRVAVATVSLLAMLVSIIMNFQLEPFTPMENQTLLIGLAIFNSVACFFAIIMELSAGNFIRGNITRRNLELVKTYQTKANIDMLTGIYNRMFANDFIAELANKNNDNIWCVAMLDVDDFKKINDTMGHAAGDEVLRSLATTLTNCLRKTDILFRWGGEEFLLFLSDVSLETATVILNKLCKQLEDTPALVSEGAIHYTVTIGVASLNPNNIHESIALCDKRLYIGKQNGKNQAVAKGGD